MTTIRTAPAGCETWWQPDLFLEAPLAARHPGDVAKLRAYGNAIVAPLAAAFIRAVMDSA